MCEHCGGSGVLNIIYSVAVSDGIPNYLPYASACHACEVGAVWSDLGLE